MTSCAPHPAYWNNLTSTESFSTAPLPPQVCIIYCLSHNGTVGQLRIKAHQKYIVDQCWPIGYTIEFRLRIVPRTDETRNKALIYVSYEDVEHIPCVVDYASRTSDGIRSHDLTLMDRLL